MKKKITLFIMTIFIIFSLSISVCYADILEPQDFFTDGFKCQLNTDGARTYTIIGYESSIYTNIIPDEIDGYKITRIANGAFKDMPQLTGRIDIPDSIISIGNEAFSGCTNITGIKLGRDLKDIGDSAFANCSSLKSIDFNSVQNIGSDAFFKCTELEPSMVMPKSLKSLGNTPFYMSSITEVKFQTNDAPTITSKTFENIEGLKIIVPKYANGYTVENYWPETVVETVLEGDINIDGLVDSADAAIVLNLFKYNNATQKDIEIADLDNNGLLDSADAAIILNIFKYSI